MAYSLWGRIIRWVAARLCLGKANTATSTSARATTPVQEGPRAPPSPDRRPTTQDSSSDVGTTVPEQRPRALTQVSSRLSISLYGHTPVAFMATSNYQDSIESLQDDELKPMTSEQDIQRICDLIQSLPVAFKESFRHALNKRFTKSRLINDLTELRQLPGPRFYYRKMWVATPSGTKNEENLIANLFGRGAKTGNVSDPARRLSSNELSELLVDPVSPVPIRMILITDFCGSFNFLRLPWTLRRAADGGFFWEKSEGYVPGTWKDDHKTLHFASGERGARTYSFACGSIFTREFYNAEHTGENNANAPVSLSKRVELICDGVNTFLEEYNLKNSPAIRQVPQVYASHPFDLDRPSALPNLLLSL